MLLFLLLLVAFPAAAAAPASQSWGLWPTLPLAPYGTRATVVREVVKDRIWTLDQLQGTLYVQVPVRMSVIREERGLVCYAPVAPTQECLQHVRAIEAKYGARVVDIVLPTLGVEHKVFVGPFARAFPKANVWYTPGQYSFPLNFRDLKFLGIDARPIDSLEGFEVLTLGPLVPPGNGGFGETAIYHRPTKTLFLVDTVVAVRGPPTVIPEKPLRFHSRSSIDEAAGDLEKGWRHLVLFAFFFQPSALTVVPVPDCFDTSANKNPGEFGYFDVYPFEWDARRTRLSFDTLRKKRLFVAPILQELILNRHPVEVQAWVDRICAFDFDKIVPCHLEPVISARPSDFRRAFDFLKTGAAPDFLEADLQALRDLEKDLVASGEISPRPLLDPPPRRRPFFMPP
ncbi:hypothetical protein CTAYLR_004185 [Chrysophaeum taylorii]|uniref:DUF4336 domain-containing protein n=1 Tax=Chrysophaeum taylorii TaxID=2483200 RepID=A0AAD7XKC2_9STRA|nr:hypothetical protein CTAYLR_004185 [Chrysophaeum taylorii]